MRNTGTITTTACFAVAAAELLGCPVINGDPEFRVAESAGVDIDWLDEER